jgi:hypothetical protein
VEVALAALAAQQHFLLQSVSAVMGEVRSSNAALAERLARLEEAVAVKREEEGGPSPELRRGRSSSVFHKSAVVV